MWHSGLWHQSGPNTATNTDDVGVGPNVAYYPTWMNNWVESGNQPLWPETYGAMPPATQEIMVGIHAHDRQVYTCI